MARPTTPVHDPQTLRALAHPVRTRILAELDARGSLRAADIARELDIPANQASFHLRQLARFGLVEEDPAAARDRRDRVWKGVAPLVVDLKEFDADVPGGGRAAARAFRRHAASWGHLLVEQLYAEERPAGHHSVADAALRLSDEEAVELQREVEELVERWTERTRGHDDVERRTYVSFHALLPYPETADAPGPA